MSPDQWRGGIAALALLVSTPGVADAGATVPRLVDEACDLELVDAALEARLRCARLIVQRDPDRPEDGTFELAVVVKRSVAPKPGAPPVLFLHGGPGGELTRYAGYNPRDFTPGHDLVAFDMRGGGRSRPQVCAASAGTLMASFLHPEGLEAGLRIRRQIVEDCRAEWQAAGLRAEHYGTARNVADAEALRQALGVAQWRLYAESYGTTVAAHYLATHPEAIGAAVLDSLYPKDAGVHSAAEMQGRLFERIAADCRQDAGCIARWPRIGRDWLDTTVAALDAEPLRVGAGTQARLLDGLGLRQLLMIAASNEAGVRALPLLVDAAARRDTGLLAGPLSLLGVQADQGGGNLAAMLATDCRDRARHQHLTDLSDPFALLLGVPNAVCRDWATPAAAPRWPAATPVPVLLLAGGYDSFQPDPTPVLVEMGPEAQLVEIPHAAHGARGAGPCVRDLVAGFLADPQSPVDTPCVAQMRAPAFLLQATPSAGMRALLPTLMFGATPPPALLAAVAATLATLLAALVGLWRSRGARHVLGSRRWLLAPAVASLLAVAAPASLLATYDPMASAALLYGLPVGWAWLPWLSLLPLAVGALALGRGQGRLIRLTAALALLTGLAWIAAGWFPGR